MGRQEQVQVSRIVPLSWLQDYVRMLRAARAVKLDDDAPDAAKAEAAEIDRQIDIRVREVQAYLDRLNQQAVH